MLGTRDCDSRTEARQVRVLLYLLCLTQWTWASPVLTAKDFASDLPVVLQSEKTTPRKLTLNIQDRARFAVEVHYDELVDHPSMFRRVEVRLPAPVDEAEVQASMGFPVNVGTLEAPVMAVPLLIQWSGQGWLRTEQWTLSRGKLEKNR